MTQDGFPPAGATPPADSAPAAPPGPPDETDRQRTEREGHFQQYWRYASHLRNWFIAFGIGGLLVVTGTGAPVGGPEVVVVASRPGRLLAVGLLLGGIVSQVVLAFLNKVITWYVYQSYFVEEETRRHRVAAWLSASLWPDIVLDLVTVGFYIVATAVLIWMLP